MNTILNRVIQWTIYIVIILILIIGYLIPLVVYIVSAVYSKQPPPVIVNCLNYAGVGFSISSLAIAAYSLYASNASQKRLEESLTNSADALHEIKVISQTIMNSQDRIESRLSIISSVADTKKGINVDDWVPDNTGPEK